MAATGLDRQRQRIVDVIITARIGGIGEEEIMSLVRAGLDDANRINATREVDWNDLPTLGSLAA